MYKYNPYTFFTAFGITDSLLMLLPMVISAALILNPPTAQADDYAKSRTLNYEFPSELSAFIHAAKAYKDISRQQDTEYMGAILQRPNGSYTYSVGKGHKGKHRIGVKIGVRKGWKIISLWHTHGAAGADREYFSDIDTALVNKTKLALYLITPRGNLKVFRPGDRTLDKLTSRELQLPRQTGYAEGFHVMFIP